MSGLVVKKVKVKTHVRKGHVVKQHMAERKVDPNNGMPEERINVKHKDVDDPSKSIEEVMKEYDWDSPPNEQGITKPQMDDILKRVYNQYRDSFDDYNDFINRDNRSIGLELESDGELYHKYFKNLPENISATDVLEAYKLGLLPKQLEKKKGTPRIEIPEKVNVKEKGVTSLGEPTKRQRLEGDALNGAQNSANMKRSKKNAEEVDKARYDIFMDHIMNTDLADRLGIKESELNKKIKSWTGMNAGSARIHQMLNRGRDQPVQWNGIVNSSFLSRQKVSPDMIDGLVNDIKLTNHTGGFYGTQGDMLRNYIGRTMLGIDTRINYSDLNFKIASLERAKGLYTGSRKLITIANNNPNTVAHEIGHYLDNKQGEECGMGDGQYASNLMDSINKKMLSERTSPLRLQQMNRFHEFILGISERSDIRSEYTQRRSEVFARFTAKFVDQANDKGGSQTYKDSHYYQDKFHETDYMNFVTLLQEKAYVDITDKNPHGVKPKRKKLKAVAK